MELLKIGVIICFCLLLIVITVSTCLLIYLLKKRNLFPYANISPLWTISFLTCIIVQQVFLFLTLILDNMKIYANFFNYSSLINTLFSHYVIIWNIYGRIYYVSKCMDFNYNFLTKKIFTNYLYHDNSKDFQNKMYSEERTHHISKIIFFPLLGLFFLFLTLSLFYYTRCILYAMDYVSITVEIYCGQLISEQFSLILRLTKQIIDILQIALLFTLLFWVLMYPLKKDPFKLRFEMYSMVTIWVSFHHTYHTMLIFGYQDVECLTSFTLNILEHLCYTMLITYLIIQRNKVEVNKFHSVLYNYDHFMRNPICFNFLLNHIKNDQEDEFFALFFYIDYKFYIMQFSNDKNEDENFIQYADFLYNEYFIMDKETSLTKNSFRMTKTFGQNNTSPLSGPMSIFSMKLFHVDFPINVVEKIQEYASKNFDFPRSVLFEIFDEAYQYVNTKLYNKYLMMFRDEEKFKKIEKLICYFDFDFSEVNDTKMNFEINKNGFGSVCSFYTN